jgi:predicted RNA-binding Zn-ribbon protein involved in translation (DUF1610 family)
MTSQKIDAIFRAKKHIEDFSLENLRYAALELRMVIEMLTYEKLLAASDLLPPSLVKTWQPPQAIKMLKEFQQFADESFEISIAKMQPDQSLVNAVEDLKNLDWISVGEHHALSHSWLSKNYHKLGKLLHAPSLAEKQSIDLENWSKDINTIKDDLERAVNSHIKNIIERGGLVFDCPECNKKIVRNLEALKRGESAFCSNANCNAEYKLASDEDGKETVTLVSVSFQCIGCQNVNVIGRYKLKSGFKFSCMNCANEYIVSHRSDIWHFHHASN